MTIHKSTLKALSTAVLCLSIFPVAQPAHAIGLTAPVIHPDVDTGSDLLIDVRQNRSGTGERGRDRDRDDDDRGRGRGGDRTDDNPKSRDDDNGGDDNRPSGRDRPRIPGGSGCDDAGDLLEHPECSS